MPEGHTIHRAARKQREVLAGDAEAAALLGDGFKEVRVRGGGGDAGGCGVVSCMSLPRCVASV